MCFCFVVETGGVNVRREERLVQRRRGRQVERDLNQRDQEGHHGRDHQARRT
jgi:hypothetical protein